MYPFLLSAKNPTKIAKGWQRMSMSAELRMPRTSQSASWLVVSVCFAPIGPSRLCAGTGHKHHQTLWTFWMLHLCVIIVCVPNSFTSAFLQCFFPIFKFFFCLSRCQTCNTRSKCRFLYKWQLLIVCVMNHSKFTFNVLWNRFYHCHHFCRKRRNLVISANVYLIDWLS